MNRFMNMSWKQAQRGFTLVEMAVVVVIIGILGSILAPSMIGTTSGAKATSLITAHQKLGQNLQILAQQAGVSTQITGNPLPNATSSVLDVLVGGSANVAAAYASAYTQAKLVPLNSHITKSGANYLVEGYVITLAGGGATPFQTVAAAVDNDTALSMAKRYDNTYTLTSLQANTAVGPLTFTGFSAAGASGTVTQSSQLQ